ncbi:hypothetical protein [Dyella nitratireducens]|uniref:Uncharacterized protein n=1 Tax=Dyella nitratireducens TaxID=1849580 RepID=A0ABQ1GCJ9_9GAMM|nr:hypothetical protein [Dyella nitratireducens]GGA41159.1 hypothetical protein GCM10010981_32950 [Dyella nitratireducens]GLQ40653.1 hypothetical protein GCM10007902_05020 [Dyella nitratireducens]
MGATVQLGNSVNVLHGLRPAWFGASGTVVPFDLPPCAAWAGFPVSEPSGRGSWGSPEVGLHDTIESLVDALFAYRVRPILADAGRFALPPSALMLGGGRRAAALASLSALLHLPVEQLDGGGLVLLQLRREDADHRHEAEEGGVGRRIHIDNYWTREGLHAMGRLRVAGHVRRHGDVDVIVHKQQADRYLDYFDTCGTHFVTRIGMGNRLFQVMVCHPQRYRLLRTLWSQSACDASGPLAKAFFAYTGDEWIASRGWIVSAADDPLLEHSVATGAWRGHHSAAADNLLAPFVRPGENIAALLDGLQRSVPIDIEFTAHSPYMENYRAIAWQRVLKGALLQRFGDAVRIPLDSAASEAGHGGDIVIHEDGDNLVLGDTTSVSASLAARLDATRSLCLFSRQLSFYSDEPITLPGQHVTLFAFSIDARGKDDRVPVVRLSDQAFATFRCYTPALTGAMQVGNETGDRWNVLFQGLHFGTDDQGRVIILGELSRPDVDTVKMLRAPLVGALADTEAQIARADAGGHAAHAHAARSALDWIYEIVRSSGVADTDENHRGVWEAIQRRAIYQSRLGSPIDRIDRDIADSAARKAHELFLRLRLLANGPGPVTDDALDVLIRDLEQASRQWTSSHPPAETDNRLLTECLAEMKAAQRRGIFALHRLLDNEQVATEQQSPDRQRAWHLLNALAWYLSDGATGRLIKTTDDAQLASALSLFFRACTTYKAAMLVHALTHDTEYLHIAEDMTIFDGEECLDMTAQEWNEFPQMLASLLAPAFGMDCSSVEELLSALRDIGAIGVRLERAVSAARRNLYLRYQADWHSDFPAPELPWMRAYHYSRHVRAVLLDKGCQPLHQQRSIDVAVTRIF